MLSVCQPQRKHLTITQFIPILLFPFTPSTSLHLPSNLPPHCQVLESNRNQIESKGVQLAANKEQLQAISLELEGRDGEIQALQQRIAEMDQQIATSLKGLLVNSASNGPTSPNPASSPHSSKVLYTLALTQPPPLTLARYCPSPNPASSPHSSKVLP